MKDSKELEKFRDVKYRMNEEGFHYCFMHYSKFENIKDKNFHKLRREYIKVSKELEEYVDKTINDLREKEYYEWIKED